jgi:hypothetical protein
MPQAHLTLFCAYYVRKAEQEEERHLMRQLQSQLRH